MSKKRKTVLSVAIKVLVAVTLTISILSFCACSDESADGNGNYSLSVTEKMLTLGDSFSLTVNTSSKSDKAVWASSNENVVKVDDGTVVAVGTGEADVTCSVNGQILTCRLTVDFGTKYPVLVLKHIVDGKLIIAKGDDYLLQGQVLFNGVYYDCNIDVQVQNGDVASYQNGSVYGKAVGQTLLHVVADWNNFSGSTLQKDIDLTVQSDVYLYAECTAHDKVSVANEMELYSVSSWQGNDYCNTATVKGIAVDSGVRKSANVQVIDGANVVDYIDETLTAKSVGNAKLKISYVDESGITFETYLNVTVLCPVVQYSSLLKFSTIEPFPTESIFGSGAEIISAKQGNKTLDVEDNVLNGVVANGADTTYIEICTTNGGYRFDNVFAYTKILTQANIANTLKLQMGKIIDGYYILEDDIDLVDLSNQTRSYFSNSSSDAYFAGTFDGQGHTLRAKVGANGVFGGLGKKAVIKDVHFDFTFGTGRCCGIARNDDVWNDNANTYVTISNVYVTSTNYYVDGDNRSYALMYYKTNNLTLHNAYIDISSANGFAYTSVSQEVASLFAVDATSLMGVCGMWDGDFRNIYVVSPFMPMACGRQSTDCFFVSYAQNDEEKLGKIVRYQDYHGTHAAECKVSPQWVGGTKVNTNDYFGHNKYDRFATDELGGYAWMYQAKGSVRGGGVWRYDNVSLLVASGILQIGSWNVSNGSWTR